MKILKKENLDVAHMTCFQMYMKESEGEWRPKTYKKWLEHKLFSILKEKEKGRTED